jgi:hypothetical protein
MKASNEVAAMRLALEALKTLLDRFDYEQFTSVCELDDAKDAIKALEAALEAHKALAKQEPVAEPHKGEPEMVRNMRMWVTALKSVSDNGQHMKIPSELSSGTCWELAVALEQFINTTPQQRTAAEGEDTRRAWVGLTDEERMDILLKLNWDKKLSHMDTALAIEAKLREKNSL